MRKHLALKAAGVITVLALGVAAPASANPYAGDPLHPDIRVGWCPGGGAQLLNGKGWCDGEDYPDGSFWHQVPMPYFGVYRVNTFCKLHTGLWLQDAPEGGCGGEWP